MDQPGIKVKNLKEINRVLKNVGVPADAIKQAGKDSAQIVVNEARALVPVRSGRLRDSIRLGATAKGKITIRGGNNTTIPYANPIHWGWFKRGILPQPFFSKALGYTREEIFDNYFKQIDKLIVEETRKARTQG